MTSVSLEIVLPLAISFFTFQQIAYLVDVYRREAEEPSFLQYAVFVMFFPQLIAGPIVHHKEMMWQFAISRTSSKLANDLIVGLSIFAIGLFKKVVLADTCAVLADPVFAQAESGGVIAFWEAWGGVLAFTFQIYFDFSAYSDMAIGIGRMFGIKLPENFNSPYKAAGIIEFWRRWHMTLSRFLRDYLYIPLGGNRNGPVSIYRNLIIVMILGGLWHGASWTFVAWGGFHGCLLIINHIWRKLKDPVVRSKGVGRIRIFISKGVTFILVVYSWAIFRAETWHGAEQLLEGMLGFNKIKVPGRIVEIWPTLGEVFLIGPDWMGSFSREWGLWGFVWLVFLVVFCWLAPNTQQFMINADPVIRDRRSNSLSQLSAGKSNWLWKPNIMTGVYIGFLAMLSIIVSMAATPNEFIYFRF